MQELPPEAQTISSVDIDPGQLKDISTRLAAQLAIDDFASGEAFDANADLMRAALGEHFKPISDAIHNFDFATALDLLAKAVAVYDIRLTKY